jgi:hypothetical protein
MDANNKNCMSDKMRSSCLAQLVRNNLLARHFIEMQNGFDCLTKWLTGECRKPGRDQLAYNVLTILWVVSFHEYTLEIFADYDRNIIEHVAKILDFYNKEKIVRITMMLFESLMRDKECLDHLAMVNALAIVTKLSNRVWVDKKIDESLDRLWKNFDANYQEFSSFEKWKKQVSKNNYAWTTVHTEKFWQHNGVNFSIDENLTWINKEIEFLQMNADNHSYEMQIKKAVICFDLGEFARTFINGRKHLENAGRGAKDAITAIMAGKNVTPELKKEAITAYQKILMKGYGQ